MPPDFSGNSSHLQLLRESLEARNVAHWNRWRDKSLERPHLEGVDLRAANLAGINLRGAVLTGARLQGARLDGACLSSSILELANLRGASLLMAAVRDARLKGADFRKASMGACELNGSDCREADFRGALRIEPETFFRCRNLATTRFDVDLESALRTRFPDAFFQD